MAVPTTEYEISLNIPINYDEYSQIMRDCNMTHRLIRNYRQKYRQSIYHDCMAVEQKTLLFSEKRQILFDHDLLDFTYTECLEVPVSLDTWISSEHDTKVTTRCFKFLDETSSSDAIKNVRLSVDKEEVINNQQYFFKCEIEFHNSMKNHIRKYANVMLKMVVANVASFKQLSFFNCINANALEIMNNNTLMYSRNFKEIPLRNFALKRTIKRCKYFSYKLDGTRHIALLQHNTCTILPSGLIITHGIQFNFKYLCFVEYVRDVYCLIDILYRVTNQFRKVIYTPVSVLDAVRFIKNVKLPSIRSSNLTNTRLYKNIFFNTINFKRIKLPQMPYTDGILCFNARSIIKCKDDNTIDLIFDLYHFTNETNPELTNFLLLSKDGKFEKFSALFSNWKIILPPFEQFVICNKTNVIQHFVTIEFNVDHNQRELTFKKLRDKPNCNTLAVIGKILNR